MKREEMKGKDGDGGRRGGEEEAESVDTERREFSSY